MLQTAIAIFSGDDNFYFQEPPPRRNETNRARERRAEYTSQSSRGTTRDGRAARRDRHRQSPTSEDQESDDQEATDQDNYERSNRGHRHSSPRVETRTVQFQDNSHEEEDKELDDLIYKLHSLSVRDFAYKQAYARCARRFPDALRGIPEPGYRDAPPTAAYSYQPAAPPPALQPWSAPAPTLVSPAANANANAIASFFRTTPRPETCAFCTAPDHRLRQCPIANEYLVSGRASIVGDRMHLPNGQPIPFDGTRRGLKASIDSWLISQTTSAPPITQTRTVFTQDPPPHLDSRNTSSSRIEEVMESHILQVKDAATSDEDEDKFSQDIFKVFATEKKKRGAKAPELSAPPPAARAPTPPPPPLTSQTPPTAASNSRPNTQYRYHCNAEEQHLVTELEDYLLQGKLSNTTPAHVFAASPAICKDIAEKIRVRRVESNEYELARPDDSQFPPPPARRTTVHKEFCDHQPAAIAHPSTFCLPLQEIDVLVNGSLKVPAILDTSSQITVICRDIAQSLGLHINNQRLIEMEGANGATNWMVGCAENLTLQVGDVSFTAHAHVIV